jgi:mannose/cellobiose epimerase-like protein (N-acyl-D-glucosamine 2-epimerase family)
MALTEPDEKKYRALINSRFVFSFAVTQRNRWAGQIDIAFYYL